MAVRNPARPWNDRLPRPGDVLELPPTRDGFPRVHGMPGLQATGSFCKSTPGGSVFFRLRYRLRRVASAKRARVLMNSDFQVQAALKSRSSKPAKLREACFEDHSAISGLAHKFGLGFEDNAAWQHLWRENPAYRGLEGKFPMGWVLEDSQGDVCGYLGNVPLSYELESKRLLAAATRSWVVDSAYRGYALMLLSPFYRQTSVDLFLGTSVNSQSGVASTLFKNVPVPVGAWDRSLFWITHARGFTESFFAKKGWKFAKPFSYPVALGLSLRDRVRRSGFRNGGSDLALTQLESFDERFDDFWAELRKRKSGVLLAVRDRETLDWHFKFALQRREAWIYILNGAGGMAGYAVFLRQERRQVGLSRVCLVDFQCLDAEKSAGFFMAVLWAAFERCRKASMHMLELIGLPPALETNAELAAPHHRRLDNWMYFYKANNAALAAKLQNPAVWEPSLFDGDSSF
jgi:hypothetical protein